MVLRCSACQATYRIDGDRVQNTRLKVRCPSCGHVFRVRSALRQPAYAGGTRSGPSSFGGREFVRDERRPPQTLPRRSLPSRTPTPPPSPPAPQPQPKRWDGERTIDFDAGRRQEKPRLETEPFRGPAQTADPAPSEPGRSATPPAAPPVEPSLESQPPGTPASQPEPGTQAPQAAAPAPWSQPQSQPLVPPPPTPTPPAAPPSPRPLGTPVLETRIEPAPSAEPPALSTPPTSDSEPPAPLAPVPTTPDTTFPEPPGQPGRTAGAPGQERHERALRLARVLVSDILVYNQEARDRALREGNLASALGAEINRAWEMYKSKVDTHVLHSTSFFKDALNEILANGQKLF